MRCVFSCLMVVWFAASVACAADQPLKDLFDQHRWFELRTEAAHKDAPTLYRGTVACAFNRIKLCEATLRSVTKHAPRSEQAFDAHGILASVYLRQGLHRKALAEIEAMLVVKPEDGEARNARPLLEAASKFPDQATARWQPFRLKLRRQNGDWGVPLTLNGKSASYTFDTGANLSLLSESEAKRLGLRVQEVESKMQVTTGANVAFRLAHAEELAIGPVRVRGVAFLVFPDDQPPFDEMAEGERGIIGISVLLALQRIAWDDEGNFEVGAAPPPKILAQTALSFDGQQPLVQLQFQGRAVTFSLDTGAGRTLLYPPFAAQFAKLVEEAGKKESKRVTGVGHTTHVDSAILPEAKFTISGFPLTLSPAPVLLTQTTSGSKYFHGNLGMDILNQPRRTIVDFVSMLLAVE